MTNSEIILSAVRSISERPKRSRSAYGSSRRRESLASATAGSAQGQSRRFDRGSATSGLPRLSKTEVGSRLSLVRSSLNNGHAGAAASCPFGAAGLMRRSKRHLYSITLSARPSSEGGTARPSALAVLRLTISSDFVGACTHLGLPYESHRLQAPDRKGSTSEVQQ